jgi:hypothetical protein
VSNVAIHGVLSRICAALADLVAELALIPAGQEAPDKAIVDQTAPIVINGNRPISFASQQAGDGGTTEPAVWILDCDEIPAHAS